MPSWRRGTTSSRLDYICTTSHLHNNIIKYTHDWSSYNSDHCSVNAKIHLPTQTKSGPGYYKINMRIFEKSDNLEIAKSHIVHSIEQIPVEWNPHMKWDYIKMEIRTICIKLSKEESKGNKLEMKLTEEELQRVTLNLDKLQATQQNSKYILEASEAIEVLKSKLNKLRDMESKRLLFNSKAKFIERREK